MTLRDEHRGKVLSAQRYADPPGWWAAVRAALESQDGIPEAAAVLGVSRSTLYAWIAAEPSLTRGLALPPRGLRRSY